MEPIKIHPFDVHILLRDNPQFNVVDMGSVATPRAAGYTINDPLMQISGTLYHVTTTVSPITAEIT